MRTPIKAIRAKCLDCCAGQVHEVKLCPAINCPIHAYRMGKRPKKPHLASDILQKKGIVEESRT